MVGCASWSLFIARLILLWIAIRNVCAQPAVDMDHKELENGTRLALDFTKLAKVANCGEDVVPAVAQDVESGEVLIVGYANQLALDTAMEEKKATFWSTSRKELWIKGLTSGNYLELVEACVNCEQNSILYRVRQVGEGACHTNDASGKARHGCYYRSIGADGTLAFRDGGLYSA